MSHRIPVVDRSLFRQHLAFACIVALAVLQGCSRADQPEEPVDPPSTPSADVPSDLLASDAVAAAPPSNLDPNAWLVTSWNANVIDLQNPSPHPEVELAASEQGLKVTTHDIRGQANVVFRKELLDDFDATVRIIFPSVEELKSEDRPRPSPFPIKVGLRGAGGGPTYKVRIRRNRDQRETYEVKVRASQRVVALTINGEQPFIRRRYQVEPVFFFLEVPDRSEAYVVDMEVREGLEPSPELAAAAENAAEQTTTGNETAASRPGMAGPPPGMFGPPPGAFGPPPGAFGPPPGAFGPPPGAFGPHAGVGPPIGGGSRPPAPSQLAPLLSVDEWFVAKQGNERRDMLISQDLRLEATREGLTVVKSSASEGVWIVRKIDRVGDFTATCRVTIPAGHELGSIAGPTTFIAVGAYPSEGNQDGAAAQAPPPLPTAAREFDFSVRRLNGRVTINVAGTPVSGSAMIDDGVLFGLYANGGIRISIHDFHLTPPTGEDAVAEAESGSDDESSATPLATRVWTDASGTRRVEATFIKLEEGKVYLRRKDGKEASTPLSGLAEADREVAKTLAGR